MTQPVKPIRAWADYDEWWVLLDGTGYEVTPGNFEPWEMPKGASGRPFNEGEYTSIVVAIEDMRRGPLRSFRALFDNGWWLELTRLRGGAVTALSDWFWYLHEGKDAPEVPHGHYSEDKDHEAVHRALTAVAAYFNPTKLGGSPE